MFSILNHIPTTQMKHFKMLMMAVFTILSAPAFSQQVAVNNPMLKQGTTDAIYTCPMHPTVTSKIAGQCSQCNMTLKVAVSTPCFSCPMHPAVTSEQPVKCSDCGMDLVRSTREKVKDMKKYACMMHTEVTSHEPGACVKCKLALKENKSR